jgi:hypothetical protein
MKEEEAETEEGSWYSDDRGSSPIATNETVDLF